MGRSREMQPKRHCTMKVLTDAIEERRYLCTPVRVLEQNIMFQNQP